VPLPTCLADTFADMLRELKGWPHRVCKCYTTAASHKALCFYGADAAGMATCNGISVEVEPHQCRLLHAQVVRSSWP
jgi:hypothetical protein